ncbi:MAG: class E sortase [Gaiellaceae bacterium]
MRAGAPRVAWIAGRALRITSGVLIAAGVLLGAWAIVVWRWQDPFALYTHREQQKLGHALALEFADFRPQRATHPGEAIGRIGLGMVLVGGSDESSLKKGPGRDPRSYMPGQRRLVYVAGHRTTYLAPFSHIDAIRPGDSIRLEMPYATFVYRMTTHRIVPADDMSVLRSPRHELLELQACHPRFFATHRYIVYAKLVAMKPRA